MYPTILYFGIPTIILFSYYYLLKKRGIVFVYPLTKSIKEVGFSAGDFKKLILRGLRTLTITSLLFLGARPQWVDVQSNINTDNIDIFLSLDTSLSMTFADDAKDRRTRIVVAKSEAAQFIKRRTNDKIGVGVFAEDSLTLAPTTDDKKFLLDVIDSIDIGVVPENSTALGKGLAVGIARLRNSKAKSKVLILLTDGKPTAQDDFPIDRGIELAKEQGVKIYTMGIGSSNPYAIDNYGRTRYIDPSISQFDESLLIKIATQTGGKYFGARKPAEVAAAYEAIDKLEKTTQEQNIFTKFEEFFSLFFGLALVSLAAEIFLSLFLWKCL